MLDIGTYRPVAHENFVKVMREHLDEFAETLRHLKEDKRCNWWPEIPEAEALVIALRAPTIEQTGAS